MTTSLQIKIRRYGRALVVVAAFAVVATSPAYGGSGPAVSFYTPEQLQAMSSNWAAKGRLLGSPDAASFYTPEQLQAMSSNWAAKGRLLGSPDAASFYTREQLRALGANWAAKGRLLDRVTPSQPVRGNGFSWSDFGMGAATVLGLVMLAGGLAAAVRHSRRDGIRARTAA